MLIRMTVSKTRTQKEYFLFRTHVTEQMPRSVAAAFCASVLSSAAAAAAAASATTSSCSSSSMTVVVVKSRVVVSCVISRMKCHRTRG